jgi:hypothetical protein
MSDEFMRHQEEVKAKISGAPSEGAIFMCFPDLPNVQEDIKGTNSNLNFNSPKQFGIKD